MAIEPEYTDTHGVKALFGFSRATLYNLLRDNKISARKLGRKTLFDVASIRRYIERQPNAGPQSHLGSRR